MADSSCFADGKLATHLQSGDRTAATALIGACTDQMLSASPNFNAYADSVSNEVRVTLAAEAAAHGHGGGKGSADTKPSVDGNVGDAQPTLEQLRKATDDNFKKVLDEQNTLWKSMQQVQTADSLCKIEIVNPSGIKTEPNPHVELTGDQCK